MYAEELLDLILSPKKTNKNCLLCLKTHETNRDVFEMLEIHGEDFSEANSLYFMMEELFPTHEILLKQACENCSELIIQFYILMKRNKVYLYSITRLVEDFNCKISQKTENTDGGSYIINLSKHPKKNCKKSLSHKKREPKQAKSHKILKQQKSEYKALICDICGKTCKTPRSLNIHRKGHESKPCPYCQKVLKTNGHFNIHVKQHETGQRRINTSKTMYRCNDCKYKCNNKESLEAHINRNHVNLRPYICEICCKGFYRKGNLKEHVQTHSIVKLNTCEKCGDSFSTKKTLADHLRLHSGEKPYSCEICSENFVSVSRKNTHVKRKHREKQKICDICGVAFSMNYDMIRHKRLVHEIDI